MSELSTPRRKEIADRVGVIVAESLALKPDEVAPGSRLIPDLGADSLDFIDLTFLIEKEFNVKLRDGELGFVSKLDFSSPEVMRDGFLTADTLTQIRDWLPALREVEDPARVTPSQLFSMITVGTLCKLVERKLIGDGAGS